MPRTSRPRYRRDRDAWTLTVQGRTRTLCHGERNRSRAERLARAILVGIDRGETLAGDAPPLGIVLAQYLEDVRARQGRGELSPRAAHDKGKLLLRFVEQHASTPVDQIDGETMDAFLAAQPWGKNTRAVFVSALRTAYRWAKRRKLIACPPPEPIERMGRKTRRDKLPTPEEMRRILDAIPARSPFRDLAEFIALTACRPSEAARIKAQHIEDGVALLTEHKTRRKTGSVRAIVLPAPARAIVARLSEVYPEGPLFRNRNGKPWNEYAWAKAFRRARTKAGVDARISLYTFRHGRATQLLIESGDLPGVAALLGNDPVVTGRVYSDVVNRHKHLKELAERGLDGGATKEGLG